MKLNHEQTEVIEIKQAEMKMLGLKLAILAAAMYVLLLTLPGLVFANPMIHNSANLGSTYWGGSWGITGGMYGEFDCSTCHAKNTGNIKRVKKDLVAPNSPGEQFPIEGSGIQMNFMDVREGSSDFGDDSNAGRIADGVTDTTSDKVCEACHTQTKFHNYDATLNAGNGGDRDHYNDADCMVCHPHNQGFKPLDCTACHGYPPTTTDNDGSTTTGLAHNPFITGSSIVGAHVMHATTLSYACENCHDGYTMPQNSTVPGLESQGDVSIGFNNFGSVSGSYSGQTGVSYNNVEGDNSVTCSTVYCHGSTIGGNNPTWTGTISCGDCHLGTNAQMDDVAALGSHQQHAGNGVGQLNLACNKCHATPGAAGHVTGNVAWDLDRTDAQFGNLAVYNGSETGTSAGRAPTATYASCSGIYCHSPGQNSTGGALAIGDTQTVQWGSVVSCGDCHDTAAIGSGSHTEHLAAASVNGCSDCHTGADNAGTAYSAATHVDTNIDVAAGVTYNAAGAPGNGYGTCAAASCHNDGTGVSVETPVWGVAGDCTICHASDMTTASHGVHLATTLYNAANCGDCHTGAVKDTTAPAGHLDGDLDVSNGYPANEPIGGAPYSSCTTAYCHSTGQSTSDGNSAVPTYNAVTWGATVSCGECHAVTEGSGLTSGSHAAHLGTAGVNGCADCHAGAANDASAYNSTDHVDQLINVNSAILYNAAGTPGNGYGTCSAASCHDDGTGTVAETPVWGTASACNECHAAAPTTGAHSAHLGSVGTLIASLDCANCHNDTVEGTTEPTGDHRDGNLDVYNSAGGDLGYTANVGSTSPTYNTETCNTSYCHGDNMPAGSTSGTTNAPTWGTTNADGCTFCHDMAPLSIGAHSGQGLTDCISCHGVGAGSINASGTGFTNGGATHINGIVEVNADDCTSCHAADVDGGKNGVHASHTDVATFLSGKTVSGGDYGTNGWYTTTWVNGAPMFGCGECHPAGEGTSHPVNGLNLDMNPAGETPPATSPKSKNTDTPSNPTFTSGSSLTCNNIYCHSDALAASRTYQLTPNWYGGALPTDGTECASCHDNGPSSGTHAMHTVGIHYKTLYDGANALMAQSGGAGSGAAHGDAATSDTISCYTCHNDTVTVDTNDQNSVCNSCHDGGVTAPVGNMSISTAGSTHVNAQADVVFDDLTTFKSRAQLRDDITSVADVTLYWTRISSYKTSNSYDLSKEPAAPSFGGDTCSNISCHNGNVTTSWDAGFKSDCASCHTSVPQ